jgi:hypothetical protein
LFFLSGVARLFLLPEFADTGKGNMANDEIITGFPAKMPLFCRLA